MERDCSDHENNKLFDLKYFGKNETGSFFSIA